MTTQPEATAVEVETRGAALHLFLNRPARKNSLTPVAVRQLIDALEGAAVDDALRAIVISGRGPDFCSGADWVTTNAGSQERPRTGSVQRRTAVQAHRLVQLVMEIQLPVVCSVRGWAAGLGCQLALAADFTIAGESSRFWEPFIARGFTPDSGATWLLPRLIGIARAKELLLLGRELSATDAAAWGVIHRTVPDDELDAATIALVEQLANGPTVAIGLAKRCINRSLEIPMADALENEAFALELSSRTGDFKEGLLAFTERRAASFQGR